MGMITWLTYPAARRAAWGLSTGAERSLICRHSACGRARARTTGQYIPGPKQTVINASGR